MHGYAESSEIHDRLYETGVGEAALIAEEFDVTRAAARLLGIDVATEIGPERLAELRERWPDGGGTLARDLIVRAGPGPRARRPTAYRTRSGAQSRDPRIGCGGLTAGRLRDQCPAVTACSSESHTLVRGQAQLRPHRRVALHPRSRPSSPSRRTHTRTSVRRPARSRRDPRHHPSTRGSLRVRTLCPNRPDLGFGRPCQRLGERVDRWWTRRADALQTRVSCLPRQCPLLEIARGLERRLQPWPIAADRPSAPPGRCRDSGESRPPRW